MSASPRVSIGLPVRNGQNFLVQALESVLGQDFGDFELIISDNASEDETEAICRNYADRDRRVQYRRFEINQGAARNYNRVFELAQGDYFKWAPHDDICLPGMLRRCVEVLDHAPDSVVLVYPLVEIIDGEGIVLRNDPTCLDARQKHPLQRLAHLLLHVGMANPVCGLHRAATLRQTRLIDSFVGSDLVLLAELTMLGQIWEIPEVLMHRRIHSATSRIANPTRRQVLAWFDPRRADRRDFLSMRMRLIVEYQRSAHRFPMPLSQRLLCFSLIPLLVYWVRFRDWGGLQKGKLKQLFPRRKGRGNAHV